MVLKDCFQACLDAEIKKKNISLTKMSMTNMFKIGM